MAILAIFETTMIHNTETIYGYLRQLLRHLWYNNNNIKQIIVRPLLLSWPVLNHPNPFVPIPKNCVPKFFVKTPTHFFNQVFFSFLCRHEEFILPAGQGIQMTNNNIFVKRFHQKGILNTFIFRYLTEYEYLIYLFLATWPNINFEYTCS